MVNLQIVHGSPVIQKLWKKCIEKVLTGVNKCIKLQGDELKRGKDTIHEIF